MARTFYLILSLALVLNHPSLFSQERGMKLVEITIDNTPITLYKESHALLIGASNYNNGLKPLPGVKDDIGAVSELLEKNGFSVRVVMDPDHTELVNAFNDFIATYGQEKEGRLLFWFAGHGYTKKIYGNDIGYLLPVNCPNPETDLAGFQTRAMPMGTVELFAQQIQSKHAIFLFDACFSGAVFSPSRDIPGIISYKTTQPVRQFITSGAADETVPDKSIFCRQFIAALNGEADLNRDSFITGTELGDFLQTTVTNYSKNSLHPQFGKIRDPNLDKGDFVFLYDTLFSRSDSRDALPSGHPDNNIGIDPETSSKKIPVFYYIGTLDELRRSGLINKQTRSISFNRKVYHELDADSRDIPISQKKVRVLTKHPSGSYKLITENNIITFLQILDPQMFWKYTNHVVILVE